MTLFERTYLGNSVEAWILALSVAVMSDILLTVAKRILARRFGVFAKTTETILDDMLVDLIVGTKSLSIATLSIYIGSAFLSLSPGFERMIQRIGAIVFLVQGVLWGGRLIRLWLTATLSKRSEEDASSVGTVTAIAFALKIALWSVAALLALDNLGFNITTLVAGLGIGGIALALAVQNVLGDIFASLSIVLDKPFVVGDFIVVDDHLGTIEYIGLKTTRIRSLSGEQIIFSNSELLKARIHNYKRMAERRVAFTVGVTYDTSIGKLKAIDPALTQIIQLQPQTRLDRVHFKEYGDSALIFEIVYFVLSPDYNTYMDIQQAINFAILEKFRAEEIEFAFPTMSIVQESNMASNKTVHGDVANHEIHHDDPRRS
jgi:small-conductance mechanosensitive channel